MKLGIHLILLIFSVINPLAAFSAVREVEGKVTIANLKCILFPLDGRLPYVILTNDRSPVYIRDGNKRGMIELFHSRFTNAVCPLPLIKEIYQKAENKFMWIQEVPLRIETTSTEPRRNSLGECVYLFEETVSFNLAQDVGKDFRLTSRETQWRKSDNCK